MTDAGGGRTVSSLTCPICLQIMSGIVYRCPNHATHRFCSDCFFSLVNPRKCPHCRRALGEFEEELIRDVESEEIIQAVENDEDHVTLTPVQKRRIKQKLARKQARLEIDSSSESEDEDEKNEDETSGSEDADESDDLGGAAAGDGGSGNSNEGEQDEPDSGGTDGDDGGRRGDPSPAVGEDVEKDNGNSPTEAEVPGRHTGKVYVESDIIISVLNQLYPYRINPKYTDLDPPRVQDMMDTHAQFVKRFRTARIETLTNGSVMFDTESLGIRPNYPYNYAAARKQIQEMVRFRLTLLVSEANRLEGTNQDASNALRRKALAFQKELPFLTVRHKYEEVISEFETLLDDCECQLRRTGFRLWCLDSRMTQVDLSFAMLLYRLWQLGFADRFWTPKKRHYIYGYFEKIKQCPSFKMVTHMEETKIETWPFVAGAVLCACAVVYETLFGK